MDKGEMKIEVLPDGRIKVETGDMGTGPQHKSADDFLALVAKMMGGDVEVEKTKHGHHHHHEHEQDHLREGGKS